jgi:hypothetical protein
MLLIAIHHPSTFRNTPETGNPCRGRGGCAHLCESGSQESHNNPLWGLIVACSLAVGFLAFFFGLALVMPVVGRSTWHLYREVVGARSKPPAGVPSATGLLSARHPKNGRNDMSI